MLFAIGSPAWTDHLGSGRPSKQPLKPNRHLLGQGERLLLALLGSGAGGGKEALAGLAAGLLAADRPARRFDCLRRIACGDQLPRAHVAAHGTHDLCGGVPRLLELAQAEASLLDELLCGVAASLDLLQCEASLTELGRAKAALAQLGRCVACRFDLLEAEVRFPSQAGGGHAFLFELLDAVPCL